MVDTVNFLVVIQKLITVAVVYFPTVTIAGYLHARFAAKLGDTTARTFGFQSLDPAVHTNLIGLFFYTISVLFPGYWGIGGGWGNPIPMSPTSVDGKYAEIKKITLFFLGTLVHAFMLVILLASIAAFEGFADKIGSIGVLIFEIAIQALVLNFFLCILNLILGAIQFMFVEGFSDVEIVKQHGFVLYFIAVIIACVFVFPFVGKYLWTVLNVVYALFRILFGKFIGM